MKLLFIGSRLYDDIDWYVRSKNIESVLTESNEEAINLDLPDQVFIVPRGMDGPNRPCRRRDRVGTATWRVPVLPPFCNT